MRVNVPNEYKEIAESCHERSATLFLALLVAGDLLFIALHVVNLKFRMDKLLNIGLDRGYAEFYQYVKFFWICIMLIYASYKWASKHYIAWVLLFTYLLLDDALRIHEIFGSHIATNLSLTPIFNLRLQDYGELAVSAISGSVLIIPLLWAYKKGSRTFRRISHDLALFIALLFFFGVVADMAHTAIRHWRRVGYLFGIIEDGGEMLTVSLILWYVFLKVTLSPNDRCYLCDLLRFIPKRRSSGRAADRC